VTALAPAEAYALWAPSYDAETAVSALESSIVASLGVAMRGRRLLDAGCGIARRLHAASDDGAALAVGIDLTPRMLERSPAGALLAAADVRAIPAADGAFDLIWCRLVVGHLPELERVYAELARVCRPGGEVVVTDFHPAAAAAGHRRTFRDGGGALREVEHHVHVAAAHLAAASRAGLSLTTHREGVVGDEIREYYARADRLDAFERQRGLPIVLALAFTRDA
jgi:malonyl-CoA O-methyltransferase